MKNRLLKILLPVLLLLSSCGLINLLDKDILQPTMVVQAKGYHRQSRNYLHKIHRYIETGTKRIIGNRNSKIYHVPGQHSYRLNMVNAIYFNSEKEAIRAGYRCSKR